ncbi:PH domain-containing protein [Pontibacter sp. MBLB2868]|uniref:PH domain-containing protein n=1 Tax=Pontibacter sp. MBLB2868 TaxID=3451555 RepID=UPI003F74E2C0
MIFKASLDGVAKAFSTVYTLLIFGVIFWQVFIFFEVPQSNSVIASLFLLGILLVPYCYHPINYCIQAERVVIRRPLKNVVIRKREIERVRMVDRHEMKGTLRSFGVAGLYGYFGKFSNLEIGSMLWYATQKRNYVLIQTRDNKHYILTPDQPEDFIQQLKLSYTTPNNA